MRALVYDGLVDTYSTPSLLSMVGYDVFGNAAETDALKVILAK